MESRPARRNPTNIVSAACGKFHAVILQEASDHVLHVTDQFTAYTGNTDVAMWLNRDTFEPDPAVFAFEEASSSKDTWSMVVLVVRGLLRRPSLSGSLTVTFCSVHIHNVVVKKRDASTDLLRRYTRTRYSTCCSTTLPSLEVTSTLLLEMCLLTQSFRLQATLSSAVVALDESNRERTGFLIMPMRP